VRATQSTTNLKRNRVTYQGITYTICTSCFDVIGSGRAEASLLAAERFHDCFSTNSGVKERNVKQISTEASRR